LTILHRNEPDILIFNPARRSFDCPYSILDEGEQASNATHDPQNLNGVFTRRTSQK
jgi:hypothetical protein